jgi:rubrerythrin
MEIKNAPVNNQEERTAGEYDVSRRRFFQLAGGLAGAGLLLSSCHKRTGPSDTYIGSGDTALLNYLYILEQLEAAFYTQAFATPYYGMSTSELQLLQDVRDQEIAHREFFKRYLVKEAIPAISPNFSAVTFADRTSVLTYAIIFEDMVISAYNGAAHLFTNTDLAISLSKMVTVEARHSAYFRDILGYNSFADTVIDANGLGQAGSPSDVLAMAEVYIHTHFDSSKLPN